MYDSGILDEEVEVWTDYLSMIYHPKSIFEVFLFFFIFILLLIPILILIFILAFYPLFHPEILSLSFLLPKRSTNIIMKLMIFWTQMMVLRL